MNDLNQFIDDLELVDFQMLERNYTWSNSQEEEKWSRIDRFLVHPEWSDKFKFKLWGLPRTISDHCPILLMEDERDWGAKPFRFNNFWFSHSNCIKVMEHAWMGNQEGDWAAFRITKKLQAMKEALKMWSKEEFGSLQTKLDQTEEQMHALDLKAETGSLQPEEMDSRRRLRSEMWKLGRNLERMWVQKSRIQWHLYGDRNTKFFHRIANSR